MSRRARQRAAPRVYSNAVQIAIARARRLSDEDVAGQRTLLRNALTEYSQCLHCARHWASLADAANMAETMASMGLGSGPHADDLIAAAQEALAAVYMRHAQRGSWTLYPAELDALHWLLALHCDTQMPACSYGELDTALARTSNRLAQARAGNASPGALVLLGNFHEPLATEQRSA